MRAALAGRGARRAVTAASVETTAAGAVPSPENGRIHYRRVWLNRPGFHGSAHLIASVALTRDEDGVDITASFLLSDCTRNVTLDLDMWTTTTAAARRNTLRKARLLRESVVAFCDAIESANAEYEADRARNRRRRRKRNRS